MADDDVSGVSLGEMWRRLRDHEIRTDRTHTELAARITELAAHTVPLGEFDRAERERDDRLARLERDHDEDLEKMRRDEIGPLSKLIEDLQKRRGIAWGWAVTGLTLLVTTVGVLVDAWTAARGAK